VIADPFAETPESAVPGHRVGRFEQEDQQCVGVLAHHADFLPAQVDGLENTVVGSPEGFLLEHVARLIYGLSHGRLEHGVLAPVGVDPPGNLRRLAGRSPVAQLTEGGQKRALFGESVRLFVCCDVYSVFQCAYTVLLLAAGVALSISETEFSERFERKPRAVTALNHPNNYRLQDGRPNCVATVV
jgi:hypothetical protein